MTAIDLFSYPKLAAATLRRGTTVLALAAAAQLALLGAATAQNPDEVVARVDGVEIRQSDLAIAEEDIGQNIAQMPDPAKREYLITYLSDMILAARAAEARKLGDADDFKRRLAYLRNKTLMELLLQTEIKGAVSEEAMRKVYDEAVKGMSGQQEVRASHILVETEDEAKAVLAEIRKGGDFAALAKQKSKDPGAADGGDLGYFGKDQMVAEFSAVAFALEPGKVSDPVKTQFGWHIIKVVDKRERPVPPFDQVKGQIETFVSRRAQVELVTKLRESGKVERLDKPQGAEPKKN